MLKAVEIIEVEIFLRIGFKLMDNIFEFTSAEKAQKRFHLFTLNLLQLSCLTIVFSANLK